MQAGHNKPLISPRSGELSSSSARAQGQAQDNEKLRKFVQLRQDLERVRNLCYMVNRREKHCRTLFKLREQTFQKQVLLLSNMSLTSTAENAILEANHAPLLYDRLYSHLDAEFQTSKLETLVARIQGQDTPTTPVSADEKKPRTDFNGASNKRLHFNGSISRKKPFSSDLSSMSCSETDQPKSNKSSINKTRIDKKLVCIFFFFFFCT